VLLVVTSLVLLSMDWKFMRQEIFTLAGVREHAKQIPTVFANTLSYTVSAFVVSLALGMILALMRLSSVRIYRWIATAYIEFFRGLPALLIVFIFAYGLPLTLGLKLPSLLLKGAIALGIVSSAYMAESLRAGIQAVPQGQVEAARSLGMTHGKTLRYVVFPQAIRIVLPPVTNEIILLTKDTSLVYIAGMTVPEWELSKLARESLTAPSGGLTALFATGALYLVITLPLGFVVRRLEKSFGKAKS